MDEKIKIFTREIKKCNSCPNRIADANITRWECFPAGRKFLIWMHDENEDNISIPDWCPLPNKEDLFEI